MELKQMNINGHGTVISQYDLEEIFLVQYNDLFSKLLSNDIKTFFSLLKNQVLLHLKIIDKRCDISLFSHFCKKYYNICGKDKCKIDNIFNKIINFENQNYMELNILDIFVHCYKCSDALHKCGNRLIICNDLFFCLKCQKVYNKDHIKLFCKECNKTYLTTKRSMSEKKNEFFYAVSFSNYHCYIENEEKIKCLNCGDDLYYNITQYVNEKHNGIRDIYCIRCKLIFDTKKIYFNCKLCGNNFKCEPQIYRNFSSIKKYLLLLVHTLRKRISAIPDTTTISNKKCNCDLNGVLYYFHSDNGALYQGKKNGKSVIICDCCYGIFKPDTFNWNCPFCGMNFNSIQLYDGSNSQNQNRKCIRKQRKIYKPISNIYEYNDFNRNSIDNYIFKSLGFSKEKPSKHLIPLLHDRGLSLDNKEKHNNSYLINYNNNNYNVYKNANRLLIKLGDKNDYKFNNSCDKILNTDNSKDRISFENKNIKFKKNYFEKEVIQKFKNNLKNSVSFANNRPHNININKQNNSNNITIYSNENKRNESTSNRKIMSMKDSKSDVNIKKIVNNNNDKYFNTSKNNIIEMNCC